MSAQMYANNLLSHAIKNLFWEKNFFFFFTYGHILMLRWMVSDINDFKAIVSIGDSCLDLSTLLSIIVMLLCVKFTSVLKKYIIFLC